MRILIISILLISMTIPSACNCGATTSTVTQTEEVTTTITHTVTSTETITVEYLSIDLSKKQIGEIKIETDKIQPEIIDKKDEFKADVSNLATSLEISTLTTLIERILGLSQENYRITSTIYDGDLLTNATIKIYPTKADCEADTNAIAIYKMFATFDAYGKCIQYQVTKE